MMNAPRVSHPREPGLFARAPNLERYRVAVGGVTLVDLQPGDGLQVIDLEARDHEARALGAAMVVALNSDASVRRQGKGDDRPINPLADRLAVMAALGCVDLVTWFDEDTPIARILECQPDVLVKGGDWPVEKIVGNSEVVGWGGRTVSIPFIHQKSTTALLEKIRTL